MLPDWWITKDGDKSCLELYKRHYSAKKAYTDGRGQHSVSHGNREGSKGKDMDRIEVAPVRCTADELKRGAQIVRELHGIKGFDAWAEHIAKALAAARARVMNFYGQSMEEAASGNFGLTEDDLA